MQPALPQTPPPHLQIHLLTILVMPLLRLPQILNQQRLHKHKLMPLLPPKPLQTPNLLQMPPLPRPLQTPLLQAPQLFLRQALLAIQRV